VVEADPDPAPAPPGLVLEETPYVAALAEHGMPAGDPSGRAGRRAGLTAFGLVVVIVVAVLAVQVTTRLNGAKGPALPAVARSLRGHVVAQALNGDLLLSAPDGTHSTRLHPGPAQGRHQPFLIDNGEAVEALAGDRIAEAARVLLGPQESASNIIGVDPFADHATAVILATGSSGSASNSTFSVATLHGDHTASLGPADDAAGDPQALGAFVSVVAVRQPRSAPPIGINGLADTRVERRDTGQPSVVLATAAQLNADVGESPNLPVNLTVFPDHSGGKVAVMVNPVGGEESNSAMVILDRTGRELGAIGVGRGPTAYTVPYWSSDDSSLAFATFASVGTALAVLDSGYHLADQPLQPDSSIGGCAWSPDSTWVVCLATSNVIDGWLLARNDTGLTPIYYLPGRGTPVAWLP
jgi:hypothetical protein